MSTPAKIILTIFLGLCLAGALYLLIVVGVVAGVYLGGVVGGSSIAPEYKDLVGFLGATSIVVSLVLLAVSDGLGWGLWRVWRKRAS